MNIEVYDDILDIDSESWNSIITPSNWLHSHAFLASIQQAKIANAVMYFIVVKNGNIVIGTAVISGFQIDLDLFIQSEKIIGIIKKMRPYFFKTKILFCGTPLSAGQRNIYATKGNELLVVNSVFQEMKKIAQKHNIKTLVFKEFSEDETTTWSILSKFGFWQANSLPSTRLNLAFESYNHYLAELKSKYLRQVKASIKKLGDSSIQIHNGWQKDIKSAYISLFGTDSVDVNVFYNMYLSVMQRTTTKLETLNYSFFKNLWNRHSNTLKLLCIVHHNNIQAAIIFTDIDTEINFLWSGKHFIKDSLESYPNLLNALVAYSIEHKKRYIILGQTSYYPKMKIGGIIEKRFFYIKSTQWYMQLIWKYWRKKIFPLCQIYQLKVFKQ